MAILSYIFRSFFNFGGLRVYFMKLTVKEIDFFHYVQGSVHNISHTKDLRNYFAPLHI